MLYVNLKLSFIYLNPHIKTTNLPVLQNFTRGPCAQNEIFYLVVVTSQKPKRKKKKKKLEQKREEASFTPHGKNCTPSTQWCWKSTHAFFCLNTELEVRLQTLKNENIKPEPDIFMHFLIALKIACLDCYLEWAGRRFKTEPVTITLLPSL